VRKKKGKIKKTPGDGTKSGVPEARTGGGVGSGGRPEPKMGSESILLFGDKKNAKKKEGENNNLPKLTKIGRVKGLRRREGGGRILRSREGVPKGKSLRVDLGSRIKRNDRGVEKSMRGSIQQTV